MVDDLTTNTGYDVHYEIYLEFTLKTSPKFSVNKLEESPWSTSLLYWMPVSRSGISMQYTMGAKHSDFTSGESWGNPVIIVGSTK